MFSGSGSLLFDRAYVQVAILLLNGYDYDCFYGLWC